MAEETPLVQVNRQHSFLQVHNAYPKRLFRCSAVAGVLKDTQVDDANTLQKPRYISVVRMTHVFQEEQAPA